jgi:RHH-type transcriptional regulator, rel operon repressor / antitoxin RelB
MLALRLNEQTEARLDHMAKITGRSKHFYATEAIETYLQSLEKKYLSAQEQAEVQALVDFSRIEMALASELDSDQLNEVEHGHYFDAKDDEFAEAMLNPTDESKAFWANLSSSRLDASGRHVWKHPDGSEKHFPPAVTAAK